MDQYQNNLSNPDMKELRVWTFKEEKTKPNFEELKQLISFISICNHVGVDDLSVSPHLAIIIDQF